jgi:hypothetical protein
MCVCMRVYVYTHKKYVRTYTYKCVCMCIRKHTQDIRTYVHIHMTTCSQKKIGKSGADLHIYCITIRRPLIYKHRNPSITPLTLAETGLIPSQKRSKSVKRDLISIYRETINHSTRVRAPGTFRALAFPPLARTHTHTYLIAHRSTFLPPSPSPSLSPPGSEKGLTVHIITNFDTRPSTEKTYTTEY